MNITISCSYYSTNTYLFSLKRRQHRRRSFGQMRSNLAFIVPRPRRSFGQVVSDNKIHHSNKVIIYGRPFELWHDIRAVFSHVYLQSFLLHDIRAFFCHVYLRFIPKYMTIFLQTRIYMRTKKPIYMRYKQACGIWGHRKPSYKRHRIIPSAKRPFMYDGAEK